MDGGLLSLKWNNHRSTLFYMLSTVRKKECYTDVTLACDGKFYSVHKLVLSMCSEYFEQMFEQTQCKHPVIVLKDIKSEELESLLSYMYVGEVNVVQEKLSGLIKAAECLKIKGLAVPDEEPCSKSSAGREKRSSDNSLNSEPKRRRQDDSGNASSFRQAHSNRNDDRRKSLDHPSSSASNKFRNTNSSNSNVNSTRPSSGDRESGERGATTLRADRRASPASNNQQQSAVDVKAEELAEASETEAVEEVMIEEPSQAVKEEPTDADAVYLSDSNSVPDHKDEVLMDSFSDVGQQQHFMDELLGQASESNHGNMGVGDYSEGGEGSSGAGGQQQQHMGRRTNAGHSGFLADHLQQEPSTGRLPLQRPEPPYNRLAASSRHRPPSFEARSYSVPQHPYSASVLELAGCQPSATALWGQEPSTSSQARGSLGGHSTCDGASSLAFQSNLFNLEDFLPSVGEGGGVSSQDAASTSEGGDSQGQACPHCGKVFRDRSNFYRHRLVHTKEKPYQCPLCDYRSSRSDNVKRHLVVRHPEFTEMNPEQPSPQQQ